LSNVQQGALANLVGNGTRHPSATEPHRIFADAFEIEIAFDEVGERAGQQHRSPQLFGEGFETRSHVDRDDRLTGMPPAGAGHTARRKYCQ
jgi:hypothetical protein